VLQGAGVRTGDLIVLTVSSCHGPNRVESPLPDLLPGVLRR
jgi:hypothetical protein